MEKFYLITFNNTAAGFDALKLNKHIKLLFKSGTIQKWWHYLPAAYIVKSDLNADELFDKISPGMPGRQALIVEIDLLNSEGMLTTDAWEWINKVQGLL
jgi:hypothetical protein